MSQPTVQDRKYRLDPPAEFALGKVTPKLAWEQVQALVAQCLEEYYQAAEELRQRMNYPVDLRNLQEVLGITDPVRGINNLVYANPDLDLKNLPDQPPLEVLQAVLKMLTSSDRWNSLKP
jgi:hypothetical protein